MAERGRKPPEYMVVQGGLTDAMVKTLIMSNTDLKGKKMVLLGGSKILLSSDMYEKLQIKGLRFEVADAAAIAGSYDQSVFGLWISF